MLHRVLPIEVEVLEDQILLEAELRPLMVLLLEAVALVLALSRRSLVPLPPLDGPVTSVLKLPLNPLLNLLRKLHQWHEILQEKAQHHAPPTESRMLTCPRHSTTSTAK